MATRPTDPTNRPSGATSTIEDDVVAAEKALTDAIIADDAAGIAGCVTEDWVIVSATGVSNGTTLIDLVASGRLTHAAMELVGPVRVRALSQTTAVLTTRITNTASYEGRQFDADEWTTDVFVERDGRWLCALTHYTSAAPS